MAAAPSAAEAPTDAPGVSWFRLGPVLVPVRRRSRRLAVTLIAAILVLGALTLALGDLGLGPAELVALFQGDMSSSTRFVLERLRGPRLLVAVGVGIALGISGALFQTVTRNPLGSPDVLGLAAGAGAGVAVVTLMAPGVSTPVGAVIGAAIAIGLVYLSTGLGFASPARVIITGIGVAAMATAVTQYVVAVVLRDHGSQLAAYIAGSLNSRSMGHAALIGAALLVLLPIVAAWSTRLQLMDLGDEVAEGLGASAVGTRTAAIVLSTVLAAAAVAVSGPIAFVALTAPHIARRMSRAPGPNLVLAGLTGAVIMLAADLLAQQVFDGLPVGIITAGVGGLYLGYLLVTEWKKASA